MKYNIGWGLTNMCNMKCQFCYSKNRRKNDGELSLKDWKKFVDDNYEYIDSINYGTGENSIIDDFFTFIEYVRDTYPSITQSLTTNGSIYDRIINNDKHYEAFKKAIDEVDVSLDFAIEDKHIAFRGQPRAYNWAINTLMVCNKLNKKTTIVFVGFEDTLQKDNIDGLFAIAKKYNAILRLNIYRPVSPDPKINERFILSYDTLKNAIEYIADKYEVISLSDALLGNIFTSNQNIVDNTGVSSIRILPEGSICPSTYLIEDKYKSEYSIRSGKILDKLSFPEFRDSVIPEECVGCKYENTCRGGVFDRRYLWYGTLDQRDPYCPIRLGEDFPTGDIKTTKTKRVSVHDDYLPTLFFKNRD